MLIKSIPKTFKQLLLVRIIRYWVSWIRYIYFVKILRQLKTYNAPDQGVSKNTIMHNLKGLSDLAVFRAPILTRPLSIIETLNFDSDILSIGPRTEGELFYLVGLGFNPEHIRGLDLISYSPWVDLGDMHQMSYPDNSFDAIILGWVLAYSEDRPKAVKEVIRIGRQGALVAIGVEYHPLDDTAILEQHGYIPGADDRILTVKEILNLFNDHIDQVYFSHDIVPSRMDVQGSVCTIFSIKK